MKSEALSIEAIWQRYDADEQRLTATLSNRMLDLAALSSGMHVLDIATGRGEPAIPAAHRVGPSGKVLGTDISGSMLQMARDRADREGVANLGLIETAAETLEGVPTQYFHVALARWGLMYLADPVAALHAIRRSIVPGGKLVAAVWVEPERVPYFMMPRQILASLVPVPAIDMSAPGTFYYADPDRMRRDLATAGFAIKHEEELTLDVMEAASADGLIEWCLAFGMRKLLDVHPANVRQLWEEAMHKSFCDLCSGGVMRLGGVTRIVLAETI